MLRHLRTLRTIPRLKDIALILGKHGYHQVAESLQAPIRTRLRRIFKWERRQTVQQPERLRMALEELGPTFIKFGQLLSSRPDLLPEPYIVELRKLQDEVQPAPFSEIQRTLEEEFQAPVERHFRDIQPEPLAAASIAQVHRARTLDGAPVVVKVRKRGLERVVQQDLQVLGLLAEFLAGWQGLRLFDPEGIVRQFERSIQAELNFDHERINLLRIRENLKDGGMIYVPRVHSDLSRSGVLTLEYLAGEKLSSRHGRPFDRDRGRDLATGISLSLLQQVFEHGIYHADPHPGNFILLEDGRVGLIDFGNVGKCTPEMTDNLLLLLVALIRRNYPEIARWLIKRSTKPPRDVDTEVLALELMDTLDPHYGIGISDIRIGGLFKSLFGIMVRHAISVPAPYVHVGRTFITLEGVVRLCSPGLELLPAIQPYMSGVLKRRWAPERLMRDVRSEATEVLAALRSYPSNLAEVLARAASGQLRVESSIPELESLERSIEQASSRIPLAILICGLVISSSILLFAQASSSGSLETILGACGFITGLLLAARMVFRG